MQYYVHSTSYIQKDKIILTSFCKYLHLWWPLKISRFVYIRISGREYPNILFDQCFWRVRWPVCKESVVLHEDKRWSWSDYGFIGKGFTSVVCWNTTNLNPSFTHTHTHRVNTKCMLYIELDKETIFKMSSQWARKNIEAFCNIKKHGMVLRGYSFARW